MCVPGDTGFRSHFHAGIMPYQSQGFQQGCQADKPTTLMDIASINCYYTNE